MKNRLRSAARVVAGAGTGVAMVAFAAPALAQDVDLPPGYEVPATPDVDANAPGLKLGDGATLADPRVLDIKFVVEDIGGAPADDDAGGDPDPDPEPDPGADTDGGAREERVGDQRKFVLQAGVLFEEGDAELSADSLASLEVVADAIKEEQPEWVNIFGFTDSQGSYEQGVALANLRSENTQVALVDLMGDGDTGIVFNLNGYSEEYYLYDNSTEEGRQKNRRVEISWPTGG
jgi:outer membrane protein OmpA-like peptidoglycan-associated protein